MKKISRLLKYLAEYKGKIGLYFLFNLFSIVFGLLSFTMVIPVLNVLFGINTTATSTAIVSPGTIAQATAYLKGLILHQDKQGSACLYMRYRYCFYDSKKPVPLSGIIYP